MEFKKYNHTKEEKIISDYWIKNNFFGPKKGKLNKKFSAGNQANVFSKFGRRKKTSKSGAKRTYEMEQDSKIRNKT